MEQFFLELFASIEDIPPLWAYVCILCIAYTENVLPPIPGDVILIMGGYLAGMGMLTFWPVVLSGTGGGALGFLTMYALGRRAGMAVLEKGRFRWLPRKAFTRVQNWMARWGAGVVLGNRFLSGARSVIALSAGIADMQLRLVTLYATLSAAVWTFLLVWLGFVLGEEWERVTEYLARYSRIIVILLAIFFASQLIRALYKEQKGERNLK